jgi:hypothetical protein
MAHGISLETMAKKSRKWQEVAAAVMTSGKKPKRMEKVGWQVKVPRTAASTTAAGAKTARMKAGHLQP